MYVKNIIPGEKIADHVDRILVFKNSQVVAPFVLPLYANGVPSLLFTSSKGKFGNNTTGHLTLFGQTVLPESVTMHENFTLVAYFFKPYTLLSLFGVAAKELTDRPIDASLIFSEKNKELQEKLVNAESVEEMIRLLDDYIFNLVCRSKRECSLVKYASAKIALDPSKESLITVQKELHLTERTFQRLFEKNIGIAPNLYRRICQFNSAFVQLNQKRYLKLSDIAFNHGYADQSHYIRAFKEFTAITPSDYFKL